MSRIRFGVGDSIVIAHTHYSIVSQDRSGVVLRTMVGDINTITKSHEELKTLYFSGDLQIVRAQLEGLSDQIKTSIKKSFELFDPAAQDEALRRLEYVQACRRFFARKIYPRNPKGYARIGRVVARYRRLVKLKILGENPATVGTEEVGGSTLRQWYWDWMRSDESVCALVPRTDLRGLSATRIDPEAISIISDRIRNRYLTLERPELSVVYGLIQGDIEMLNETRPIKLAVPSYSSVRRWLDANFSDYEKTFFREGKRAAEQKYRHVHRAPQTQRPLEEVQIDHTPLDILAKSAASALLNRRQRRKLNRSGGTLRLWLTVAVCTTTRMIVGWHISEEAPNWQSVMHCLRMLILPKNPALYGALSQYPVFGVPERLFIDNGREFHSRSLHSAAGQLRMELRWLRRRTPHLHGKVESLNRTINRDFPSFFAGRTFRDVRAKGDYDSVGRAAFTPAEIEKLFGLWVIDIYHNRKHRGLMGRSPLQCWSDVEHFGVRLPPSAKEVAAAVAVTVSRKITSKGITFLGLPYQSDELQAMHRKDGFIGRDYLVQLDAEDIGHMLVLSDEKQDWVSVPCLYPELADGVSLNEWKSIVSLARKIETNADRVSTKTLLYARQRLAAEADAKGAKQEKLVEQDTSWFVSHADDPLFQISALDEPPVGDDVAPSSGTESNNRSTDGVSPSNAPAGSRKSRKVGDTPFASRAPDEAIDDHDEDDDWSIDGGSKAAE
jgi:putative transposase